VMIKAPMGRLFLLPPRKHVCNARKCRSNEAVLQVP